MLRSSCSKFSYRSNNPNEISLLSSSKLIGEGMRELIQERCLAAGVEIVRMEFMEVSYHVEVAQSLL